MKLKAYSLTLLLAYLAILCHNVVPHYHHVISGGVHNVQHVHNLGHTQHQTSEGYNNHQHNYHDHGYHHHSHEHPHEHPHPKNPNAVTAYNNQVTSLYTHSLADDHVTVSQPENNHSHGFPWHHHISPANEFNYLRLINKFISSSPDFSLLAFFNDGDSCKAIVPLLEQRRWCYEYPFLIYSRYEPGATGLRGPPSIA